MAHEQSTLRPTGHTGASRDGTSLALTILGHPSLDRIGERALLRELDAGREIALSRISPEFAPLDSLWSTRPLEDPFLSRLGITLRKTRGGVELLRGESAMEVEANGERLDRGQTFAAEALQAGVVLELAHRVVLVLHMLPAPAVPSVEKSAGDLGMVGASATGLVVAEHQPC